MPEMTPRMNNDHCAPAVPDYGFTTRLAILRAGILATVFILPLVSLAADNWAVDGANGTLYVHGALTESACRLEMSNVRQEVALGEIGTARLATLGAQGTPVDVQLQLVDCLRSPASQRDERTGAMTWAQDQPAITVSFRSPADADNPQLIKAQGVTGLAIRLSDPAGHDVRLGSRGAPLFLMPGQNTLTYTFTPERTRAPLMVGEYRAAVDFTLSYD